MTKKWIGINLLLLVIAAAAGWQLYDSVNRFSAENDLSKIQPDESLSQKAAQDTILPAPLKPGFYNPSAFAVIPEKNLFSESRKKADAENAPVATGTMPAAQKPLLVGVILSEEQKVASLREPQGRGRSSQTLLKRVGDIYEGYKITEIERDHIVLDNGSQKETVYLKDSSQPAQRTGTTVISTRVIPIGGGGAIAGIVPVSVVSGRTGPSRTVPTPATARPADSGEESAVRNNITAVPVAVPGAQPSSPAPASNVQQPAAQTPAASPAGATTRGSRVVRSPWGEIVRPNP
jgi:hypothetical protein